MPRVDTPSGASWEVRRTALRWRPRRRIGFDLDPIGILLGLAGLVLLPFEYLAAAVAGIGRASTIEASTEGPPPRRLRWRVRGRAASTEKVDEIVRRLTAGEDVSADADERQVGP